MSFKQKFIELCNENGVSPSKVCAKIGITPASYSCWTDKSVPRKTTLMKTSAYFGVTVDYLLGKTDTKTKKPTGVKIPVLGRVAAGIPIEAITDVEDWEEIPADMAKTGEFAALRIRGDSMNPRMEDGDVVIVRIQEDCNSGDIAVVMINGCDATCKRLVKTTDGIRLESFNPTYKPMTFTNQEVLELPIRLFGVVVELRAKF